MGKNTTKGDKKIVLQDQLYEEILNGFEEVPGSVDAKKVILNTVYKKRLERVGEYFFANKETHHFVKTWAGNLSGTSLMDEMLEKMMSVKQKA
jgi:deoxyribose-phosphate aldolase